MTQENNGEKTAKSSRNVEIISPAPAARSYKARLFEMIFHKKDELLKLYNAVNGTDYQDPELLEINTLENAVYMSMKNDISLLLISSCICMSTSPHTVRIFLCATCCTFRICIPAWCRGRICTEQKRSVFPHRIF